MSRNFEGGMLLFSDLHLSPKTLTTCLQVLRHVHALATHKNMRVGFLGDFFDRVYNEGTLPVDILNELLRFFELEWQVPMVMIPGNHDYFDASETEHGLTPFKYASKHIRIVDEPTMIEGQLWIPWRRDVETLKRIIGQHPACEVIFGHFDIVGFKLNATCVSTEGLAPSMFPDGVPIYTGHYHTPQVHGNIRYLGSPYQLSLSEAEDNKSLVVLDAHWHVSELIPLEIGRKQYKWTANELLTRADSLRRDDRVSVTCSLTDHSLSSLLVSLRERGVSVQIKRPTMQVETRVEKQEEMSHFELLRAYAKRSETDTTSSAWCRMLKWLKSNPSKQKIAKANPVEPIQMTLEGIGPFPGPLKLSLRGNGFTLVSGECNATHGSSNGAGKSLLTAGAWLWACTGQVDGRGSLSFDADTSVIHEHSETAQVSVSGLLRNAPWKIMRSLSGQGRQRKHHLRLFINHIERTRSTLSGTQKAIASELFGIDVSASGLHQWLLRNCVWSQQSVSRWLDANDTQAKQEIHSLADMETWLALNSWTKLCVKEAKDKVASSTVLVSTKKNISEAAEARHKDNVKRAEEWSETRAQRIRVIDSQIEKLQGTLDNTAVPENIECLREEEKECTELEVKVADLTMCVAKMTAHCEQLERQIPKEWLERDLSSLEQSMRNQTSPNVDEAATRKEQCLAEKKARHIQLELKKEELEAFQSKGECSACKRPFERGEGHHNHLRQLKQQLERSRMEYVNANSAHVDAQQKYIHIKKEHGVYHQRIEMIQKIKSLRRAQKNIKESSASLKTSKECLKDVQRRVDDLRRRQMIYSQTMEIRNELVRTLRSLRSQRRELDSRTCPIDTSSVEKIETVADYADAKYALDNFRVELEEATAMQKWSGPRGIQTYAMEHTVQRLAGCVTEWLRRFFKTDQVRLRAYFDEKERLRRFVDCPEHKGIMSGGQWRRAQLASFMAWREMSGAALPLLIMDEACTSMDAEGIHSVQQTLRDWCEEVPDRTCFFITHEPEQHRDTSVYQHHIKILHKRGRSSLADETASKRFKK